MAGGVDLSFVLKVGDNKKFDLYDLSGERSKFFITVNGKYGSAGTDFSCNYWPSTYSTPKIETIKRETAAMTDSSFVYLIGNNANTSIVKDISFDMSLNEGVSVNEATNFTVKQGDRNVSCLPQTVTGASHEILNLFFYNLIDLDGNVYGKMVGGEPTQSFIRVCFISSGIEFITKCGLYLSKSEAENDDDGTNREHNLLTKITAVSGNLFYHFTSFYHPDSYVKALNLENSLGDYDLSKQNTASTPTLIGAWGLANLPQPFWPGDNNEFANIKGKAGNVLSHHYLPSAQGHGLIVTLDKQYNIMNNKLYFRTSCTRGANSNTRFNIAVTDSTSGSSNWRNCTFTWVESSTTYNSKTSSLWSNTNIASGATATFPWSSSDNRNQWPTTSVCNMIRARVYDCDVSPVVPPVGNFTLRAYGHQFNIAGITRTADRKQITIEKRWTIDQGYVLSTDEFLVGDFEIVFEFSRFEYCMLNIYTTDSPTSTMDDFYSHGTVLSTYAYSNKSHLIRCNTNQLMSSVYTDSVSKASYSMLTGYGHGTGHPLQGIYQSKTHGCFFKIKRTGNSVTIRIATSLNGTYGTSITGMSLTSEQALTGTIKNGHDRVVITFGHYSGASVAGVTIKAHKL